MRKPREEQAEIATDSRAVSGIRRASDYSYVNQAGHHLQSFTFSCALTTVNPSDCGWHYYISPFRRPVASFHPATRHLRGTLMARTSAASEALVCLLLTSARGTTGLPTAARPNDLPGCPHRAFGTQPDL